MIGVEGVAEQVGEDLGLERRPGGCQDGAVYDCAVSVVRSSAMVKPNQARWQAPAYDDKGPGGVRLGDVAWVVAHLEAEYASADLGNRLDPVEELVWIPLTRQTHRQNALRSWQRIVERGGPAALLEMAEGELVALLKDAGFSRQKARWIRRSLEMVVEQFGCLSLEATAGWTDDEVEAYLRSLPGVAIKSAKCVMMYSLDRKVLPVDTHLRRLAERLGWVPEGLSEKTVHEHLEAIVPPKQRYRLHVNAIWHGRSICRAVRPRCQQCVLRGGCKLGINEP